MLQLALRQQQLHAAHMQIKLQHQTNLVVGEHNVQHLHQLHDKQQHEQQQQQQGTLFTVDQLGSPGLGPLPASDELNVAACLNATSSSWRTHDEPHTTMSTTAHTTLANSDLRLPQSITQVCTSFTIC